jgi:protein-S-isoprenylcysteine O-methyltransferase Ste14
MLFRALVAFLALPGVVAYVVPLWLAPDHTGGAPWHWTGGALVAIGSSRLVSSGPYRLSRNPMYVAVTLVLLGWCTWFASRRLLVYAIVVLVAFQLRIVLYEEPRLAASFGDAWRRYREAVRRWL